MEFLFWSMKNADGPYDEGDNDAIVLDVNLACPLIIHHENAMPVKDSEETTRESMGEYDTCDISATMKKFERTRNKEKSRKMKKVVRLGIKCMVGSAILFIPLHFFDTRHYISDYIQTIFGTMLTFIFNCGIVIMSTVPYDLYDIDDMMDAHHTIRIVWGVASIGAGLTISAMAPYIQGVPLVIGGLIVVISPCMPIKFSVGSSIFCIVMAFSFGTFSAYNIVYSKYGHLNEHTLFGQDSYEDSVQGENSTVPWIICSALSFVLGVLILWLWLQHNPEIRLSICSPFPWKFSNQACFQAYYGFMTGSGSLLLAQGISITICKGGDVIKRFGLFLGPTMMIPVLTVVIVGRNKLFNYMAVAFDSDPRRLKQDGAFVADLLDKLYVERDQIWWIHRAPGEERTEYEDTNPKRNWLSGVVTEVTEKHFVVQLDSDNVGLPDSSIVKVDLPDSSIVKVDLPDSSIVNVDPAREQEIKREHLIKMAEDNLRCIEWEIIRDNPVLFSASPRESQADKANLFTFSRPLKKDEKIDYFISHAWKDSGTKKFDLLAIFADAFFASKGRYPTFWFDRCCLDQKKISDSLKVLPINLMACDSLLLLCGETYMSRLWCAWELYTHFSFRTFEAAATHMQILPIGSNTDVTHEVTTPPSLSLTSPLMTQHSPLAKQNSSESQNAWERLDAMIVEADGGNFAKELNDFRVSNCTCYDPNETRRLTSVIEAAGVDRFEKIIHLMAASFTENLKGNGDRRRRGSELNVIQRIKELVGLNGSPRDRTLSSPNSVNM